LEIAYLMLDGNPRARRLLIVANRSPFTAVEKGGQLQFKESAGGLVSGLTAYLNSLGASQHEIDYVWVGWPGGTISEENREPLRRKALKDYNSYPVFLSEGEMDRFYRGFCNKTLWPLFHYFPSYARYESEYWDVYKEVNEAFCEAVLEVMRPGDIIWVHDYQLMLLPRMIRERVPDAQIGFFLHIPFPSFEIYRLLPKVWCAELLHGLLGADLIGFHTYDYTQYFLRSVLRVLGYEHNMGQVFIGERVVKAETFPLGIDYAKYADAALSPEVVEERVALRSSLREMKLILSIDRLDYSKGIINRLRGYEKFLEDNLYLHKKVVLALVVIPSRVGVEQYDETLENIERMVGRINGRFGRIDWVPIRYQYRSVPFDALIALYSSSDIALVTPLRDGMNLIAKEYLAARSGQNGVLILSEMAGASKELGEALIINPNSKEEISEALKEAIDMPIEEQMRRNRMMQERLRRYNVVRWAEEFMRELDLSVERQERYKARLIGAKVREQLAADYRLAKRRVIFLDYDGTLMPFAKDPQSVVPTNRVTSLLSVLLEDPGNDVFLVSGRPKEILDEWFGGLPLGLVAEHGVWIKERGTEWRMLQPLSNDWKENIRPVLEMYVDRLPGSFIEEKGFSLVWHYRAADPELGEMRANELTAYLVSFTANIEVQVLQGHKVIEVKSAGVNKGVAARHLMAEKEYDFIMAIGDDWTDEYLFAMLPETAYSIRVGMIQSSARFNVRGPDQVLQLLEGLTAADADLVNQPA
jgi:trehalose 6-phosphate synthase/phosphatase